MFWACAQLQPNRTRLALHFLSERRFDPYFPRLSEREPLFGGYCFIAIELQWHLAEKSPGVISVIKNGLRPASVPDSEVERWRRLQGADGYVRLPKPPKAPSLRRGDRVRVVRGILAGQVALYDGMRGSERVAVLLSLLGRVELPRRDIVST
jgi:transcription antitermination factor NusG